MSYARRLRNLELYGSLEIGTPRLKKCKLRYAAFWNAQLGRCPYCSQMMVIGDLLLRPTWDHIVPKSRDGKNGIRNLILVCHECNNKKGNKNLWEFMTSDIAQRLEQVHITVEKCLGVQR